ncbi:MAG TPA: hypothetical protein VF469_15760 [Kofleriaceae bacterium]
MPNDDDLTERLRRLGFRLPRDAFAAFLTHLHKSRVGPPKPSSNSPSLQCGVDAGHTIEALSARCAAPAARNVSADEDASVDEE